MKYFDFTNPRLWQNKFSGLIVWCDGSHIGDQFKGLVVNKRGGEDFILGKEYYFEKSLFSKMKKDEERNNT